MHEWLIASRARLAADVGDDPDTYDLDADEMEKLLDLARVAANESGDRRNAPLISYLVGLARGRHADRRLADLADTAASAD